MDSLAEATTYDLKDKILGLLVNHPQSSAEAIQRILRAPQGYQKLKRLCCCLGPEYSRQVLDFVPQQQWETIIRTKATIEKDYALKSIYDELKSERSAPAPLSSEADLFQFAKNLDNSAFVRCFENALPHQIALIATFWSPTEMRQILSRLPSDQAKQVILHISRIERVPFEEVQALASAFAQELRTRVQIPPPFKHQPPEKSVCQVDTLTGLRLRLQAHEKREAQILAYLQCESRPALQELQKRKYFDLTRKLTDLVESRYEETLTPS